MPQTRRPKSPRAPLTRARIATAALALLDREGDPGLTMRALGRELGVEAMALYHHLPSREALLGEVVAHFLAAVDLPAEGPWEARLVAGAWAYREAALAHPAAFRLLLAGRSREAESAFADRLLGLFLQAGFPPPEAARAYLGVRAFLDGALLQALNAPPEAAPDQVHLGRCAPALGRDLAKAHFAYGLERHCAELRRQLKAFPLARLGG